MGLDQRVHSAIFQMDKQQGSTVQQVALCSVFTEQPWWGESLGRMIYEYRPAGHPTRTKYANFVNRLYSKTK